MKILIILTSFNTIILISFAVILVGALYFEYKKNAKKMGVKSGPYKTNDTKTRDQKLHRK